MRLPHGPEPGRGALQRFVPRSLPKRATAGVTNERMAMRVIRLIVRLK